MGKSRAERVTTMGQTVFMSDAAPPATPPGTRTRAELDACFEHITGAPSVEGTLELVVRRPDVDHREVLDRGELDAETGLVGDNWRSRGSSRRPDGSSDPDKQITLMNARVIDAITDGDRSRWPEAGDQLFVDLDLSEDNLPGGTRLQIGEAVIEITAAPHTGCAKFRARFGEDALKFVNDDRGRAQGFRGRNAKVITPAPITQGDKIKRLPT